MLTYLVASSAEALFRRYVERYCTLSDTNLDPQTYVHTVIETYTTDIKIDGRDIELGLWDNAGQEGYEKLRPLAYHESYMLMICFSINERDSLDNARDNVSALRCTSRMNG